MSINTQAIIKMAEVAGTVAMQAGGVPALIGLGLVIGAKSVELYNQGVDDGTLTPEEIAAYKPLIDRISAAQAMVTPYEKEKPQKGA